MHSHDRRTTIEKEILTRICFILWGGGGVVVICSDIIANANKSSRRNKHLFCQVLASDKETAFYHNNVRNICHHFLDTKSNVLHT